jgi:hypothetical protein
MSAGQSKISVLRAALEIFGIVFLRFRPIQRIWVIWLVMANAAGVMFIDHAEGLVALGAVGVAVTLQALIYQRKNFVRILGATHILWLPMLGWMASRIPGLPEDERGLRIWLIALIATNSVSLAIDAWDAARDLRGEQHPHYVW